MVREWKIKLHISRLFLAGLLGATSSLLGLGGGRSRLRGRTRRFLLRARRRFLCLKHNRYSISLPFLRIFHKKSSFQVIILKEKFSASDKFFKIESYVITSKCSFVSSHLLWCRCCCSLLAVSSLGLSSFSGRSSGLLSLGGWCRSLK